MSEEQLLGIMPADLKGWKQLDYYNLYITINRIVTGKTGSGQLTRSYSGKMLLTHYAWGVKIGDKLSGVKEKTPVEIRSEDDSKYKEMPLDAILTVDKSNFEIPFSSVKNVTLRKFADWRGGKHFFQMIIESDKKRNFVVNPAYYDALQNLLKQIIPTKLTFKDGALF